MGLERALGFLFGRHIPVCREDFQKTYTDYYTLQYTGGGSLKLTLNEVEYKPEPGEFWSARPPWAMHIRPLTPDGWWEHRYIAFRGALVQEWIGEGLLPSEPIYGGPVFNWPERFDEVLRLSRKTDRWSRLKAVDALEMLLLDLARSHAEGKPETQTWYQTVMGAITDYDNWPLDYERLAVEVGMSPATLHRRFHEVTGMALHQFALGARISEAQRLLADSDLPIKEIARRLGYRDLYYFSRQFKQQVGAAPREFRGSFRLARVKE
ncbi:MAG: AraC family transcriptional regulator [Alkalispirochaetaceae bacterium]